MRGLDFAVVQATVSAVWFTAPLMLLFWAMNHRSFVRRNHVTRGYSPKMKKAMPEIEQGATIPFKVRETFPGRFLGIKEWTLEEINLIITSYKERYPEEWQAYLDAESNNGFISSAMSDRICLFIEELFPGLHRKHYRAGVVDFRFANERTFHFSMWQPENRLLRRENLLAHIKKHRQIVNGKVEWNEGQAIILLEHIQNNDPDLWAYYCDAYNNIGFVGLGIVGRIKAHIAALFPLPEDCSNNGVMRGLLDEANRWYGFEMLKPENAKILDRLETEWFNERRGWMTFEDWHQQVKLRTENSSDKHD